MTLSLTLNNALSGLQANTQQAETISANVANALTEGFGRRDVALSSSGITGGVRVDAITRASAPGVTEARRVADAAAASAFVLADASSNLANAIGEPGAPGALATNADRLNAALTKAADSPESAVFLKDAALAAGDYAATINRIAAEAMSLRASADASIANQVQTINSSLTKIQSINGEIKARQISGEDVSGLLDQRENLIREVSGMIPVRTIERPLGEVAIYAQNGGQLLDGKVFELGFEATPGASAGATIANGGLSGLTANGFAVEIGATNGGGLFDGGSLSASFRVRDDLATDALGALDALAADLISRVQGLPADATLGPTDAGLFTDGGGAFDPANLSGISLRISLNSAADPDAGGQASRLRDGLNAATEGLSGNATVLRGLQDALNGIVSAPGAGGLTGARDVAGFATELSAGLLSAADRADDAALFERGAADTLRDAELAETGVDTDQELSRLLQVEQAFSANARVVEVVDELFQRLLRI